MKKFHSLAAHAAMLLSAAASPRWRSMTDFSESNLGTGTDDSPLMKTFAYKDDVPGGGGLLQSGATKKASASSGIIGEYGSGHLGSVSPTRSAGINSSHKPAAMHVLRKKREFGRAEIDDKASGGAGAKSGTSYFAGGTLRTKKADFNDKAPLAELSRAHQAAMAQSSGVGCFAAARAG